MFKTILEMVCDECRRHVAATSQGLVTLAAPDGWVAWSTDTNRDIVYKTYVAGPVLAFCCNTCISNWLRRRVDWNRVSSVTVATAHGGVFTVDSVPDSAVYAAAAAHNASCLIVNNIERN